MKYFSSKRNPFKSIFNYFKKQEKKCNNYPKSDQINRNIDVKSVTLIHRINE